MSERPGAENPGTPSAPAVGELLPRGAEAFGLRYKRRRIDLYFSDRKNRFAGRSKK